LNLHQPVFSFVNRQWLVDANRQSNWASIAISLLRSTFLAFLALFLTDRLGEIRTSVLVSFNLRATAGYPSLIVSAGAVMLETLNIHHFKVHRELSVSLSPITVLVGPNGCGKSTVLEAIWCLSQMASGAAPGAVFELDRSIGDVRSAGSSGSVELEASGTVEGSGFQAKWWSEGEDDRGSFEMHWIDGTKTSIQSFDEILVPDKRLVRGIGGAVWRRLDPKALARPDKSDDETPRMADNGSGLASFLAHMKLNRDAVFEELLAALRQIVPGVLGIRFDKKKYVIPAKYVSEPRSPGWVEPQVEIRNRVLFDTDRGEGIPGHRASEGTLLTLGILATLFDPDAPSLILLEEPERALHPRAFAEFVSHLRRLVERHDRLQVVMATHSPYLLSAFQPEEIRLMNLEAGYQSACLPMTKHGDFEKWRNVMVPGEFWVFADAARAVEG
jgi:energy-coupling factor transporter ATP-binding protein EcfA2